MNESIYLSIIIPAYNEEKRLLKTLQEIDAYLRVQPYSYEIILVNDGSNDQTKERANQAALAKLIIINNEQNQGKGFVVRQGILAAKGSYRLFTDADSSVPPDQIEKLWPAFKQGYEVVIGSRAVKGAIINPIQPWLRRFVGKAGNMLIQSIGGLWKIHDSQCGFKCFNAKAAQEVFSKAKINRWGFDIEALLLAKKLGYRTKEIPVVWKNNPESRVKSRDILQTLLELFQIRLNFILNKYGL